MVPSLAPIAKEAAPHAQSLPLGSGPSPAAAAAAAAPPAEALLAAPSPSSLPPSDPLPQSTARAVDPSRSPEEGATPSAAVVALQQPQSAPIVGVAAAGGADSAKSPALLPSTAAPQPQRQARSASGSRDNREKRGSTQPADRSDSDQRAMLSAPPSPTGPRVDHDRSSFSSSASPQPEFGADLVFSGAASAAPSAAAASAAAAPLPMRSVPSGSAASLGPSPSSEMTHGSNVPLLGVKTALAGGAATGPAAAAVVPGPFAAAAVSLRAAFSQASRSAASSAQSAAAFAAGADACTGAGGGAGVAQWAAAAGPAHCLVVDAACLTADSNDELQMKAVLAAGSEDVLELVLRWMPALREQPSSAARRCCLR